MASSTQPGGNYPKLSVSQLLKAAFNCYQRSFITNATATAVVGMLVFGLYILLFPFITGTSVEGFAQLLKNDPEGLQKLISSNRFYINTSVFSLLINCILAPLSAGYYLSFQKVSQSQTPTLKDVFSYFNSPYTARILGYVLLLTAIKESLFWLLTSLGMPSLHMSLVLILNLLFTFTVPLLIFHDFSIFRAMGNSSSRASMVLFFVFLALVIGFIGAASGLLLFGFGFVLTLPFFYAIKYVLYLMIWKTNNS
ncbi:MAG: hypothetical protein Q4G08_05450 [Capnocytophaga sp.]|nr:hypothetical protein [Capnocytophaga sp.]